jgi:hypothetical protein
VVQQQGPQHRGGLTAQINGHCHLTIKLRVVVRVQEFLPTSLTLASTPLAQNLATESQVGSLQLMMATEPKIAIVTERM